MHVTFSSAPPVMQRLRVPPNMHARIEGQSFTKLNFRAQNATNKDISGTSLTLKIILDSYSIRYSQKKKEERYIGYIYQPCLTSMMTKSGSATGDSTWRMSSFWFILR